ncbi:MAG: GDSL-type esterase/lipase family protein [Bacteroidota bacterium]
MKIKIILSALFAMTISLAMGQTQFNSYGVRKYQTGDSLQILGSSPGQSLILPTTKMLRAIATQTGVKNANNWGLVNQKIKTNTSLNIIFQGTSLTYGQGGNGLGVVPLNGSSNSRDNLAYPEATKALLDTLGYLNISVLNHGYPGDRTTEGLTRWSVPTNGVLMLEYAPNDANNYGGYPSGPVPIETFIANLRLMATRAINNGVAVGFVIAPLTQTPEENRTIKLYDEALIKVAIELNAPLFDTRKNTDWMGASVSSDGLHLSHIGNSEMANQIVAQIISPNYSTDVFNGYSTLARRMPIQSNFNLNGYFNPATDYPTGLFAVTDTLVNGVGNKHQSYIIVNVKERGTFTFNGFSSEGAIRRLTLSYGNGIVKGNVVFDMLNPDKLPSKYRDSISTFILEPGLRLIKIRADYVDNAYGTSSQFFLEKLSFKTISTKNPTIDAVTTNTNQTDLAGNKTWVGTHTFTNTVSANISGSANRFKGRDINGNYANAIGTFWVQAGDGNFSEALITTVQSTLGTGYKQVRTASGSGVATTISIAHGLTGVTSSSYVSAIANNAASAGIQYVTVDATSVNIFYTVAPASGTNNLTYSIEIKP